MSSMFILAPSCCNFRACAGGHFIIVKCQFFHSCCNFRVCAGGHNDPSSRTYDDAGCNFRVCAGGHLTVDYSGDPNNVATFAYVQVDTSNG